MRQPSAMTRTARRCTGAGVLVLACLAWPVAVTGSSSLAVAAGGSRCHGQLATVVGTAGDDRLRGTPGRDVVAAGTGWDDIKTFDGNDLICAAKGRDFIAAGAGDDRVDAGRDGCLADSGCYNYGDLIYDGPGDDRYNGGPGRSDTVTFERSALPVTANLRRGAVVGSDTDGDGTGDHDQIHGVEAFAATPFADHIIGSAGDDQINADPRKPPSWARGGDVVRTGDGDDLISAGPGPNDVRTGAGTDQVTSAGGTMALGFGNDRAETRGAHEVDVVTGPDDDYVFVVGADTDADLGFGDDTLYVSWRVGAATVTAVGGPGRDQLVGGTGAQELRGDSGADLLSGGADDDTLDGGTGDDTLDGGPGIDVGDGGPQRVQDVCRELEQQTGCEEEPDLGDITCQGLPVTIIGTPYEDELMGTEDADVIAARAGNDRVLGNGGDDVVCAGADDDFVEAGAGDDSIRGGPGEATLHGDAGTDVLRGGPDGDTLDGGAGNDDLVGWSAAGAPEHVAGGPGDDRIEVRDESGSAVEVSYADAANGIIVDLAAGTATGEGTDVLVDVHVLTATSFTDEITGSPGNDRILGVAGSDVIDAGGGDDFVNAGDTGSDDVELSGGPGNDILSGYLGDDLLRGGPGDDQLNGTVGEDIGYGGPDEDACYGFETTFGCEVEALGRTEPH